MNLTLIGIAVLFAILDWIAVARKWQIVEYIAKPAVMVCLIAWLVMNSGMTVPLLWFTIGLAFSLAGDVFLMLPKERFIPGLISFLLAHIAYIIGLNTTPHPDDGRHPHSPGARRAGFDCGCIHASRRGWLPAAITGLKCRCWHTRLSSA